MGDIFNELFLRPTLNLLVLIYQVFSSLPIPYPLGFSIIALTVIIRFIMYPLISAQLKASKKMQDLSPHISNLKTKHKGDNTRIQQETMKLYKEHGVNPAAGCLPLLIQLPVIWALYSVLSEIVTLSPEKAVARINSEAYIPFLKLSSPWDQSFFGLPLGQNASHLASSMPLILLIPLLTAGLQFVQSKMMFSKPKALAAVKNDKNKDKKEKSKEEDFATIFQTQSTYIYPLMIGFFSYNFPIGLSLYWNTFTIFGIVQQYRVSGLGGLTDLKEKIWTLKKKK